VSTFSSATAVSLKQRLDKLVLEGHQRRHEEFPFRKHLDAALHQQGMCFVQSASAQLIFQNARHYINTSILPIIKKL